MTVPAALHWPEEERPLTASGDPASGLVVPIADVARRLSLDPANLTEDQTAKITDAIVDATAVVEGELNRPLVPEETTLYGVQPYALAYGGLLDSATWPVLQRAVDTVTVVSATANPDGSFNLVVRVGLDGSKIPAIAAFVRAWAVEGLRLDPSSNMGQLAVTSVSAEGQSISYEKRSTTDGAAGALPTLRSLRHWKRMSAYQAGSRLGAPWPYTPTRSPGTWRH